MHVYVAVMRTTLELLRDSGIQGLNVVIRLVWQPLVPAEPSH